jgi:hypothetical protein
MSPAAGCVLSAGEAPVGAGHVRAGRGGVQGQADRRLPRLRRHALAHRRRPRRRVHVRHGTPTRSFPFLAFPPSPVLFLNGPLTPYSPGTHQMRRAVRSVAKHFLTAIVSGRGRDKVTSIR